MEKLNTFQINIKKSLKKCIPNTNLLKNKENDEINEILTNTLMPVEENSHRNNYVS